MSGINATKSGVANGERRPKARNCICNYWDDDQSLLLRQRELRGACMDRGFVGSCERRDLGANTVLT